MLSIFQAFAKAICRTLVPEVLTLHLPPVSLVKSYSSFTSHLTYYFLQEGIPENIL